MTRRQQPENRSGPRSVVPGRMVIGAGLPDSRESLGKCAERLGQLQPRKRRAEAIVNATREGQVLGRGLPRDVEAVGFGVDVGVTIGRRQQV